MAGETLRSSGRSRGGDERGQLKRGMENNTGSKRGELLIGRTADLRKKITEERRWETKKIQREVHERYKQGDWAKDVEKKVEQRRAALMRKIEKLPQESRARAKGEWRVDRELDYFVRNERTKELRAELAKVEKEARRTYALKVKELYKSDRKARQAL